MGFFVDTLLFDLNDMTYENVRKIIIVIIIVALIGEATRSLSHFTPYA